VDILDKVQEWTEAVEEYGATRTFERAYGIAWRDNAGELHVVAMRGTATDRERLEGKKGITDATPSAHCHFDEVARNVLFAGSTDPQLRMEAELALQRFCWLHGI